MRRQKKQGNTNNLRPLLLLLLFVFALFAFSFLYRLITTIQASKFDGGRFTIFVQTSKDKTKQIQFFSIDPQSKNGTLMRLTEPQKQSFTKMSFGIPVDASIASTHTLTEKNVSKFFFMLTIDPRVKTDLTIVDLIQLGIAALALPGGSIETVEVTSLDTTNRSITQDLFLDQKILKENLSVQIINATGVSGVGALFSHIVSNTGGNVVSVLTSDSIQKKSQIIYYGKKMYTVQKIEKLFTFPTGEMKKEGIADIIIILGVDYTKSL